MQADSLKKFQADFVQSAKCWGTFFGALRQNRQEVMGMKKIFACLLCVLLLAGCGAKENPAEEGLAPETKENMQENEIQAPGTGLFLEMEHAVYDPSLTRYTYFLRNDTEETVEFGEDYAIQRQEDGSWRDLTRVENAGFTAIGYALEPGGTVALTCGFDLYEEKPEGETYRLVKHVGGETLYAEFKIGDSPYTAETPYGFGPLEELPEDYGAASASDTDVVFTGDGVQNDGLAEEFLYKVSLGVPCQLRTLQDYGEGLPMVIDVIFENDSFLWRMWSDGKIYEKRYAYIVTDGGDLYLSNGADWENTVSRDSEKAFLLPEGTAAWLVPAAEDMTADRLAGNAARYRVWSPDGVWDAMLTEEPTEFGVGWQKPGEGSRGGMYDLQDWDGLETAILSLAWQEDGRLRLDCETVTGGTGVLYFDPETEQLTDR